MTAEWIPREASGCLDDDAIAKPPSHDTLRHLFEQLSSSNVSKWIELPMICVMGDTSSGKSSLLSNLSGVELPASHTLTTKCPIVLQLSRGEKQASVRVQWRTASIPELPDFGERIIRPENWDTIASVVLEAQAFILEHSGKEVAHDLISLRIQTPDSIDLTLVDLPGLVRSKAKEESETMIQDIRSLVKEYLHNKRCVILAIVPANVDFHNHQILADALDVDPTTERTIPVITKPDLIDPGAEGDAIDLFRGKKIPFRLGFHMVRCRGQAALDRHQSIADGLADEEEFFQLVAPWKSIESRCDLGTTNLRQKLADLQLKMIRGNLPHVLQEIRQKRQESAKTLKEMGGLLSTPFERRRFYQDTCDALLAHVHASLSGKGCKGQKPSSAAKLHDAVGDFMARIRQSSLSTMQIVLEGSHVLVTTPRGLVRGEVVHLDEKYACVDKVDEEDERSDFLFEYVGLHTQEIVEQNDVWSDDNRVCIARGDNLYDVMKKIPIAHIVTDPEWLKTKIAENRTDDLFCFLNVDVFKNITAGFIEDEWKPVCLQLLDKTRSIILQAVDDAISKAVSTIRFPELRFDIERRCRLTIKELSSQALDQLTATLDAEKHPYTSLTDDLFRRIATDRQSRLKRDLEVALRVDQEGVFDTQAIRDIVEGVFERNRQTSVEDYMAEEMERVLSAYGRVATKRILDRIPMISWHVFRSAPATIQASLSSVTDEALTVSMQDLPEFSRKHRQASDVLHEMTTAIEFFESIA